MSPLIYGPGQNLGTFQVDSSIPRVRERIANKIYKEERDLNVYAGFYKMLKRKRDVCRKLKR